MCNWKLQKEIWVLVSRNWVFWQRLWVLVIFEADERGNNSHLTVHSTGSEAITLNSMFVLFLMSMYKMKSGFAACLRLLLLIVDYRRQRQSLCRTGVFILQIFKLIIEQAPSPTTPSINIATMCWLFQSNNLSNHMVIMI